MARVAPLHARFGLAMGPRQHTTRRVASSPNTVGHSPLSLSEIRFELKYMKHCTETSATFQEQPHV